MTDLTVGIVGARSFVGPALLNMLAGQGRIVAFSRELPAGKESSDVEWHQISSLSPHDKTIKLDIVISLLPIWILVDWLPSMENLGLRRLVALSSTSILSKRSSPDGSERELAVRLERSERLLTTWAAAQSVDCIILRPTMIYGGTKGSALAQMARLIHRFGFFPILDRASGLRQPVHVDDVATACISAMTRGMPGKAYTLSGGEVLSCFEMIRRIFDALGKPVRIISIPGPLLRLAFLPLRCLRRYRHWSFGMCQRMNSNQAFSHEEAQRDLNFAPKKFEIDEDDLSSR